MTRHVNGLVSAIRFITILPIGKSGTFEPRGMVSFFPVVGLLVGILLALFDLAVSKLWAPPVAAILDVVFLAAVTGAFHLDGLGDSADGLFGHRPKEKVMRIMKDSRIGVMALVAIVCGLSVKWGGIAYLDEYRFLFLVIIPAYARGSMIFGFRFLEYGRPGGIANDLFEKPMDIWDFKWMPVPILLSLIAGWRGLSVIVAFVIAVALILYYYKRRLGCITGDMLGAMTEATEALLFLTVAMGNGSC